METNLLKKIIFERLTYLDCYFLFKFIKCLVFILSLSVKFINDEIVTTTFLAFNFLFMESLAQFTFAYSKTILFLFK